MQAHRATARPRPPDDTAICFSWCELSLTPVHTAQSPMYGISWKKSFPFRPHRCAGHWARARDRALPSSWR